MEEFLTSHAMPAFFGALLGGGVGAIFAAILFTMISNDQLDRIESATRPETGETDAV